MQKRAESQIPICSASWDLISKTDSVIRVSHVPTLLLPVKFLVMDKSIVNRVLKTARIGLTEQKQLVKSNITNNIMIYNVCFDSIIGISNTTYEQYFKQLYAEQELESRAVFYRNAKRIHYSFESVLS